VNPAPNRAGFVPRGRHLFAYDVVAVGVAIVGAFALRFDASDIVAAIRPYLPVCLLPLIVQPPVNALFGLYRREWRYASVREVIGVAAAVGTGSTIVAVLLVILSFLDAPGTAGMPRSFVLLEGILSLVLIGGGRFALRWALENTTATSESEVDRGVRTLVFGAGEAGAEVARISHRERAMRVRLVGFLDDDPNKRGSRLHGMKIFGGLDRLEEAVEATRARQLLVAMPSAPGVTVRRVVDAAERLGLAVQIVQPLHEVLRGPDHVHDIRPVRVEDLLRREPVKVDLEELAGYLNGASVLVTGAGGSIGSELARQVLTLGPRRLALADSSESALWAIERELSDRPGIDRPAVAGHLCDVRSGAAVDRLMRDVAPDVVFHAAALKHVPICEAQPAEAVLTNVIGTRNVLAAAEETGVSRFVLISTDKAVQPIGVMGATKRLAEILTLAAGQRTGRSHMAVRFGNVLDSSGSVVPIFRQQLEQRLPLTITHRDATRYFMTIPEAVSLILQAGASETSGDIYVLDMGEPVRILDLASDMIRLSGLDPEQVEIVFTGLRPGERLNERLTYDHEAVEATEHDRVWRARSARSLGIAEPIETILTRLGAAAMAADDHAVRIELAASGVLGAGHTVVPSEALA